MSQESNQITSLNESTAWPTDRPPDNKMSLSFPKTKAFLWDRTATGNPAFLHIGYHRKPKVCIPERILRLIQHQCENYSQTHHLLIGSLVVEDDGEGVQFQVDRLDTRDKIPTDGSGLAPGDLLIPLEVTNNKDQERTGNVEDYHCAIKRLKSRCCSKSSIDLCEFVLLRGWGSYYSNTHTSVVHLDFDMVTTQIVFKAEPITPVPILLTALSKNLSGPMSLSHMQGTPKTGYLSMDHTRKLLLVLESDPKASTLPLVGIWVSGVEFVQHPYVWAACSRYIHSNHLQDRVCMPPEDFLLVVYTPLLSRPQFYQCCPTSGNTAVQFQLSSGHEVTNMSKALSTPCHNFMEIELLPVEGGHKMEVFDAAQAVNSLDRSSASVGNRVSFSEDIEPKTSAPTPHMERVPSIRPMVPDVSILWTESLDYVGSTPQVSHYSTDFPGKFSQQNIPSSAVAPLGHSYMSQGHPRPTHGTPYLPSASHASDLSATSPGHPHTFHNTPYVQAAPHTSNNGASSQVQQIQHLPHQVYNGRSTHPRTPLSGVHPGNHSMPGISSHQQNGHPGNSNFNNSVSFPVPAKAPVYLTSSHQQSSIQMDQYTKPSDGPVTNGPITTHIQPQASGNKHYQFLQGQGVSPQLHVSSNISAQTFCPTQSQLRGNRMPLATNIAFTPSPSTIHGLKDISVPTANLQNVQGSHPRIDIPPFPVRAENKPSNSKMVNSTSPQACLQTVVEERSLCRSSSPQFPQGNRQILNGSIQASHSQQQGHSRRNNRSSSSSGDSSSSSVTPDIGKLYPSHEEMQREHTSSGDRSSGGQLRSASQASVSPATLANSSTPGAAAGNLDSVRWDEVPPAVRALLEQQNQQLQLLQQQIQLLLLNQSQQTNPSINQSQQTIRPQSKNQPSMPITANREATNAQHSNLSFESLPSNCKAEMCSVGVNTTFLEDSSNHAEAIHHLTTSHSVQTSPVHPSGQEKSLILSPVLSSGDDTHRCENAITKSGNTPIELRHHNQPPTCSTTYESPLSRAGHMTTRHSRVPQHNHPDVGSQKMKGVSAARMDTVHNDLSSAMAALPIQDQTTHTEVSEPILDMPDYISATSDGLGLEGSRSPPSVSACYEEGQNDSNSTVAEDAMDPKQYYSQLMNNIQMFLKNDTNQEADTSEDQKIIEANMLKLSSPLKCGSVGPSSANSSIIPRINYVSMMLGNSICGTPQGTTGLDPGQSMEINAMAMKYLSDEQLTQMAKLRHLQDASDSSSRKSGDGPITSNQVLHHVLGGYPDDTGEVSRLGISPNDLTLATQNYLEKHGLLGGEDTSADAAAKFTALERSIRLRTDFSMAVSAAGSEKFASNMAGKVQSPLKSLDNHFVNGANSEYGDAQNPSHGGQLTHQTPASDTRSPPVQRPQASKANAIPAPHRVANVRRAEARATCQSSNQRQNDSLSTEDGEENILDIARLKQMPKLL